MLTAGQGLALTRVGFGLYFVVQALDKTSRGWFGDGGPLTQFIQGQLPRAEGFYQPFLTGTVLTNAGMFAQLVTLGEWIAGLSLMFGLLTRLGGITAMFLVAQYMLMKGLPNGGGSIDRLFFLSCLAFCLASAGLVWGLDGRLTALRRNAVIRWLAGLPAHVDAAEHDLAPSTAPAGARSR